MSVCSLSTRFGGVPVNVAIPPMLAPYATASASPFAINLSSRVSLSLNFELSVSASFFLVGSSVTSTGLCLLSPLQFKKEKEKQKGR